MKLFKPKPSSILYPLSVILSLFAAGMAHGASVSCNTWADVTNNLAKDGKTLKIVSDITVAASDGCATVAKTATIDLNGKTVTCADDRLAESLFSIGSGASLTVTDSSATASGAIKGPSGTVTANGGVFSVTEDGTLVVNGGTFSGFNVATNGGVIAAKEANITIAGGSFLNDKAGCADGSNGSGGAIWARDTDFTVSGGVFIGNGAAVAGTENICLDNAEGTLSGGLFENWPAAFDARLETGFVRVNLGARAVIGKSVIVADSKIRFGTFAFDPAALPYKTYDLLASGSTSTPLGDLWTVTDGSTVACTTWADLEAALEAGLGACLAADVTMESSGAVAIAGSSVAATLDLNGHTLARVAGAAEEPMFELTDSATLTVLDSVGGGRIVGPDATLAAEGGVFSVSNANLTVTDVTITNFTTSANGGVLRIWGNATVTLESSTFSDCTAELDGSVAYASSYLDDSASDTPVTMTPVISVSDCIFRGNVSGGGAFCVDGAKLTVDSALFAGNVGADGTVRDFAVSNEGEITLNGGVFDWTSDLSSCTFGAGCRRGLAGAFAAVGKNVLTDGTHIRSGVFSFDPTNAPYAECPLVDTAVSTVTEAGGQWTVATAGDSGRASCWTWDEAVAALAGGANAFLVTNATMSEARLVLPKNGKVRLDLAGHTLERSGSDTDSSPFKLADAELTVEDTVGGGRITGPDGGGNFTSSLFTVGEDGVLSVTGVTFACFSASVPGPVVSVTEGSVTLDACTITNCSAVNEMAGAIYAEEAKLVLKACDVLDCSSDRYGGAIYATDCPTCELGFGLCRGNTAFLTGDLLVVVNGTAVVTTGRFEGGAARGKVPVAVGSAGTVKIRGGVFDYMQLSTTVKPDDGFSARTGGAYTVFGQDLVASDGYVRSGCFTFDPKADIYWNTGAFYPQSTSAPEGTMWRLTDGFVACSDWAAVKAALESGRDAVLACDVTATDEGVKIATASTVSFDLAGHVLKHSGNSSAKAMFDLSGGASLTVETTAESGSIVGDDATLSGAGAFVLSGGASLELAGGAISNFTWSGRSGGAIRATDGATVTMTGGTIARCSVTGSDVRGGAVSVEGATFVLAGGTIANCSSTAYGGAVSATAGATLRLTNGTIRACSATYGGAVAIDACTVGEVSDILFLQNSATVQGGIAYLSGTAATFGSGLCLGNTAVSGNNFYVKDKTLTFHGGVFNNWEDSSNFKYVSGFSSADVGTYRVIGKDIKTSGSTLIGGSYSFDPSAEPYATCNLIDPNLSWVSRDAATSLYLVKTLDQKEAQQITSAMTPGTVLQEGIYEVTNNVTFDGNDVGAGVNGLSIAPGATVAIYVKQSYRLTVIGGDGSGTTGGGAGFEVPSDATLIFVGKGKVTAQGGCSGTAGNGGNGGNPTYVTKYDKFNPYLKSGAGGGGGNGAGGAGAGVGGKGGNGGAGGGGGAAKDFTGYHPELNGADGGNGGTGGDGGSMGAFYVLGNVNVTAKAGALYDSAGGAGSAGTETYSWQYDYATALRYGIGHGGGGGGGGVMTNEASAVGRGSVGGGGGGGGGSGNVNWEWNFSGRQCNGCSGVGGSGGTADGETADPRYTDSSGSKQGNTRGGYGGSGGACGKQASDGELYTSDAAVVSDGNIKEYRQNHPFLERTVKLDLAGGAVKGDTSVVTKSAYLYIDLPEVPLPDKAGCLFLGYYSMPEGGKQYYDDTGTAVVEFWDRDFAESTLYAQWREITPPAGALVVTSLTDEPFDPDATAISLRAAITWAIHFPGLTGADGTMSKITFSDNLTEGATKITAALTQGAIHVNESRFFTHPLIIEGPGLSTCNVIVDGSSLGGILEIGSENAVRLSGLTLQNASSDGSGGAIESKATNLVVESCIFKNNRAEAYGGAVSASTGTVRFVACQFNSNKATNKDGGAINASDGASVTVTNCSFYSNTAGGDGGAIAGRANFDIVNATFIYNKATSGCGGGYCLGEGCGKKGINRLANCTFRSNTALLGAGLDLTADGRVTLINVLSAQNTATSDASSSDIRYEDPAVVTAKGVLAMKSNLTGGEECTVDSSLKSSEIFKFTTTGSKTVTIADCPQYVEVLKADDSNKARTGYNSSVFRTDITGRTFESCQRGSYWSIVDKPGLVVQTLDDAVDAEDGVLSLREIVKRLRDGDDDYLDLEQDGVFPITFSDSLSGVLSLEDPQFDVKNLEGKTVDIDGGNRVTIRGYALTDASSPGYRAFTVWPGNTLRVKNLAFYGNVGTPYSAIATEGGNGGAINNRGTLEAENCTFKACSAQLKSGNLTGYGGAIANGTDVTGATATVSKCTFTACCAAKGGAIYNFAGNTLTVLDSAFMTNSVGGGTAILSAEGGAIYNASGATLTYSGTTFAGNTAKIDGVDTPSDINAQVLDTPAVAVTVANGAMSVSLCASAAPTLTTGTARDGAQALPEPSVDFTDASEVSVMPANVQPYLYYGLGRSATPDGEYVVSEWVKAGADGSLPQSLKAPKTGDSGFYRVECSLNGK